MAGDRLRAFGRLFARQQKQIGVYFVYAGERELGDFRRFDRQRCDDDRQHDLFHYAFARIFKLEAQRKMNVEAEEDISEEVELNSLKRIKTPQEKKRLSYAKDCRNVYGESDKGSRISIKRNKTFPNRAYRHRVTQALNSEAKVMGDEN